MCLQRIILPRYVSMNNKMNSHWSFLLLLSIVIYQLKFVNTSITPSTSKLQSYYEYDNVLISLFQDCNLQLRNIIVFDNSSRSTTANVLSNLQKPIGIKLKSMLEIDELYLMSQVDPIEIQGLVLVINHRDEWPVICENAALYWELNNNCVIFLVLKVPGACLHSPIVLQSMAKLHFAKTFFICMHENYSEPAIYTHDPYGDTEPLNWLRVQQSEVSLWDWTLYVRLYNKADICPGFMFNRTNLSKDSRVMVSIAQEITGNKELVFIYAGDRSNVHNVPLMEMIDQLERILDMNFTYHIYCHMIGVDGNLRRHNLLLTTAVNVFLNDFMRGSRKPHLTVSYPTYYDFHAIVSKDRGPATPLEKIANFYGIWTLVSLIVVSILCFIVVWFKTNGCISAAFFDIIRLLINSGIVTPIDTLPLKIFFTMIFLYFIVIQSTFSGQLSKFLTIPEYLNNINSIDDLTAPWIETVNSYFYVLDEEEPSTKIIAKKYVHHYSQAACFDAIKNKTNDVCIGPYWPFQRTIVNRKLTGYHLSNYPLSEARGSILFRQRFPLIEKFNWALIALSETRIYHRTSILANEIVALKAKRMSATKQYDYRPISFNDLKFALVLLITGNSIAFIIFLFEIFAGQYKKMNKTIKGPNKKRRIRKIQVKPIVV